MSIFSTAQRENRDVHVVLQGLPQKNMNKKTPVADQEQKIDMIEHINDDHQEELCAIVDGYVAKAEEATPLIEDIFVEGCLISVVSPNPNESDGREHIFVPFQLKGDMEEKVLHLAYTAKVKQGKPLAGSQKRYFEVVDKQKITANMLRLVLKTDFALPENAPGYAYLFAQKVLSKAPTAKPSKDTDRASKLTTAFNRSFLWVMKVISSKQRQAILASMNKGMRYYTLYRAHRENSDTAFPNIAWVDVFIHGKTQGSLWAKQLQKGDIISSSNDYEENIDNLYQGQAVLLADESAFPALAAILQQWKNAQAPIVILISAKQGEQDYLPDTALPDSSLCHRFVGKQAQLVGEILACLKSQPQIDVAWGAMEKQTAKQIRFYLRNERGLTGKNNRVKAYWVEKK